MTPEPEPITQVSVTAKCVNLGTDNLTFDVAYNFNNNPDPYTATGNVSAGSSRTFSAYTVPVGGKIGFKLSYQSSYQAEYTVTDASAEVEVTCTRSASAPFIYTVTDNLSRQVFTFTESEEK